MRIHTSRSSYICVHPVRVRAANSVRCSHANAVAAAAHCPPILSAYPCTHTHTNIYRRHMHACLDVLVHAHVLHVRLEALYLSAARPRRRARNCPHARSQTRRVRMRKCSRAAHALCATAAATSRTMCYGIPLALVCLCCTYTHTHIYVMPALSAPAIRLCNQQTNMVHRIYAPRTRI